MASAGAVCGLVEFGILQYGGSALLTSGRASVDADAVDIHVWVLLGCGLDPRYAVGQTCILEVLVAYLLKLLRAERRAHGVELYDDEAQLGKRGGGPVVGYKVLGYVCAARACVDVLYDWIFLLGVEVGRALDNAPHKGLAVAARGGEDLGGLPPLGLKSRDVGLLELHNQLARAAVAQLRDGGRVGLRVGVHKERAVGREDSRVLTLLGRKTYGITLVDTHTVVVHQIGVLLGVHAAGGEIDDALFLVYVHDTAHVPLAAGDLTLHCARSHVVEIDVVVVVALTCPQQLLAVAYVPTPQTAVVDELAARLLHDGTYGVRSGRILQQTVDLVSALVVFEIYLVAVAEPIGVSEVVLVAEELGRGGVERTCGHIDDARLAVVDLIAGLAVLHGVELGLQLVRGRRLDEAHVVFLGAAQLARGDARAVGGPRHVA